MVVVQLGEDVRSVRWKIGMEANEYLSPWRLINTKAQEICQKTYGNTPLKQANTLPAITELKNYYVNNKESEDDETRQKILEALTVDGFAAWIIHNAIKRNNDKHRRAQQATQPSTPPNSSGAGSTRGVESNASGTAMFDPVRNI
ncbi:MAG: hypothetical protein Q9161_001369 [Pseudevernia consocians]